jgi:hypothetical protein
MTVVLFSLSQELEEDHLGEVVSLVDLLAADPVYVLAQDLGKPLVQIERHT